MSHRALSQVPSFWDMALFQAKATAFRIRRSGAEMRNRAAAPRHERGEALAKAPMLASVSSPLWPKLAGEKDRALTAGKIQNLRQAVRHLNGIEVPAGCLFSFWRQIGRTTRSRGFVMGRELREGCLIANIGGGLCQLSNALYEAALTAGFDIVERHAHSRLVPGSRASVGRDATVFWNYVDLRFRSLRPFRIEVSLRGGALVVALRGYALPALRKETDLDVDAVQPANDCTRCGETDCQRHDAEKPLSPLGEEGPSAWLVDACWPEFSILFAATARSDDALFLPQRLRQSPRHAWPEGVAAEETCATLTAMRRALSVRRAPKQGRALQDMLLYYDAALAHHYARKLSHLHTHLVISQNLLPHLWRLGELEGRSFDVLMVRHPMEVLEAKLDAAKAHYPASPTLADFRAPDDIVVAESAALAAARRLYTPHSGIAAADLSRTQQLDWIMPVAREKVARRGKSVLFPASALARKGAYALRDAIRGLDLDVIVAGRASEHDGDFWGNSRVRPLENGHWPTELAGVVLPALVEHEPRALLKALAQGLPVIATEDCGLGAMEGLTTVPAYDATGLRDALASLA
jgi:VanW like protein